MKKLNSNRVGLLLVSGMVPFLSSAAVVPEQNLNYSYIYFENGYPTPLSHRRPQSEANVLARANPDLVIQTGYYSLMLDCDDMQLKGYDTLAGSDYLTALHEDVATFTPANLLLRVYKDGVAYDCVSAVFQDTADPLVRLIQSNRYVQRFDHLGLVFKAGDGTVLDVEGRFEMTAWADHVVFLLDFSGVPGVTRTTIQIISPGAQTHLSDAMDDRVTLALKPHEDLKIGAMNPASYITYAKNKATGVNLAVRFDGDEHALHVDVPATSVSYPAAIDRVDEYVIDVTNPTGTADNIPLVFDQVTPRAITGTIMTLCEDGDGRPIGIPVQISKNWHKDAAHPTAHEGSWLRGYTMLKLAPGETRRVRLRVIYGYWAGAGAVSHSQLCLIGWGRNWKWDESALGSWGESFTYDPTLHAGAAFMDDVRPSFTMGYATGTPHNWTENVGGGDFLIYRDASNTYRWGKRLKTCYNWSGPNMTDVHYSGITDDHKIRFTYTSRAVRAIDYHRRFHTYTYEFLQDVVSPRRLVYHQMAADYYLGPTFTTYYRGNAAGLVQSYTANPGGNVYKGSAIPFANQWLAIDDVIALDGSTGRARRGIISLSSTLNGSALPVYLHTYGRTWGSDRLLFDLSANSVTRSYSAGDVVKGELEFILPPKTPGDYWGTDAEFISRLESYGANAWQAVYDEFRYNARLDFSAHAGTRLRNYPVEIQSSNNETVLADFTIYSGGIGHVPVVLKGVAPGLALQAQLWSGGAWVPLATANATKNNDYQGVMNSDGTMEVVFNITRSSMNLADSWRVRIVSGSSTALQGGYGDWIYGFGLHGTNVAATANPDLDPANNLYEYGLGGDPTNGADIGAEPVLKNGSNYVDHVHVRRAAPSNELSYALALATDLQHGPWITNEGYTVEGHGPVLGDFDTVTSRIGTAVEDTRFIKLVIEQL